MIPLGEGDPDDHHDPDPPRPPPGRDRPGVGHLGNAATAQPAGRWLGQDGHDLVGGKPGPAKNDYQDIHIALKGLPAEPGRSSRS